MRPSPNSNDVGMDGLRFEKEDLELRQPLNKLSWCRDFGQFHKEIGKLVKETWWRYVGRGGFDSYA